VPAPGFIRRLIRRFGFDLTRHPAKSDPWPKLVTLLKSHGITLVLDVGANSGQYARRLRDYGYAGRIVSYEPQSAAHAELARNAAGDRQWEIAPRAAVGAAPGEITIHISAESDMSSARELTEETAKIFTSSRMLAKETAPVVTLRAEIALRATPSDRVFVKSDTQGFEDAVLDGLGDAAARVAGLQLELALHPIYQGQKRYLELLQRIEAAGYAPLLLIPGYWSRHHGRMLEFDLVAFR
jgi:FkbM family methyltransferase